MTELIPHLDRSVAGRVVFITGAASGIGRAAAHVFARQGARVALADIDAEGIEAVAGAIRSEGGDAVGYALDVADAAAIVTVMAQVAADFGRLDCDVNNAGVGRLTPLDDPDYDAGWQWQFDFMLTAHQPIIRAALPLLRSSDAARIANVASTEALGATQKNSAYVAAKHGVVGLTRALAVDLGRDGITVNCVCPGPVITGLTARIPEDQRTTFALRRSALGRYAEPVEIAHMILSLCLPAASYITGAVVAVDGGLTARNA